ncbi:MAG: riboflavin synthase subunit alpha [bacterium]|nr:MAG: riboflavin synthase subunit alpha [bacterium]
MFTGLIEETGEVRAIRKGEVSFQITIAASKIMEELRLGDSVCTSGACLTVVNLTKDSFTVDIMAETVKHTNFKDMKTGNRVNLERAMRLSDRVAGHLVAGHVDGVGEITRIQKDGIATLMTIKTPKNLAAQMVDKGSVAVDGISLTITKTGSDNFQVSIIPHTARETTLLTKKTGEKVNIETDMIGKYVRNFLTQSQESQNAKREIDTRFLSENGFL